MGNDFLPYSNLDLGGEINLRKEIETLFHDEKRAHWVIYRRFDITKPSTSLVGITQEAVQGEKYEFTDELIEVRSSVFPVARMGFDQESKNILGLLQDGTLFFYVKHDQNPKTSDKIFEINYRGRPTAVPPPEEYHTSYDIHSVMPMRELDFGRVEYYIILCRISNRG